MMRKALLSLTSVSAAAIVTLSCGDEVSTDVAPLSPRSELSQETTPASVKAPETPPGTDGLFLRLSERIPGGFAGLFVGDDGKLHMWLKDPSQASSAVAELQRFYAGTRREAQAGDVVVEAADYTWSELYGWYTRVLDEVWTHPEVVATDIDEKANRIRVSVDNIGVVGDVEAGIFDLEVPTSAVTFDVRSRAAFFGSVRDRIKAGRRRD